jgi:hypothetical protein
VGLINWFAKNVKINTLDRLAVLFEGDLKSISRTTNIIMENPISHSTLSITTIGLGPWKK